jgi:hypothetical protein
MYESKNEIFDNTKDLINSSLSTIYSKEDVINIIEKLKQKILLIKDDRPRIDLDEIEFLVEKSLNRLESSPDSLFDTGSAEFSIDFYNKIILEHVSLNTSEIAKAITNELSSIL